MAESVSVSIRLGEKSDCGGILGLIKELAIFEKMEEQVKIRTEDLVRDGFERNPPFFKCLVAENESQLVGYALYFHKYSTWEGRGIHLEDLYVTPPFRNKGIATKLLRALAQVGVDGGYARLTLECLDWNKEAIEYYKRLNGIDLTQEQGWHVFRFTRNRILELANGGTNLK